MRTGGMAGVSSEENRISGFDFLMAYDYENISWRQEKLDFGRAYSMYLCTWNWCM